MDKPERNKIIRTLVDAGYPKIRIIQAFKVSGTTIDYICKPDEERKRKARALSRKLFPNPEPCEVCGADEEVERHHPDYDDPTTIIWLCPPCHTDLHKLLRE